MTQILWQNADSFTACQQRYKEAETYWKTCRTKVMEIEERFDTQQVGVTALDDIYAQCVSAFRSYMKARNALRKAARKERTV